jgi:hypothetical protein
MRFYCKCGHYFGKSMLLQEHIGICNPRWPRTSPEDEHRRVTEEEWRADRAKQYAILRGE